MADNYEPVFLPNDAILAKKYKVGDTINMKVTAVMDDGVRAVCSHRRSDGQKEMAERTTERYREAMG